MEEKEKKEEKEECLMNWHSNDLRGQASWSKMLYQGTYYYTIQNSFWYNNALYSSAADLKKFNVWFRSSTYTRYLYCVNIITCSHAKYFTKY